jgi:hypothetical protein
MRSARIAPQDIGHGRMRQGLCLCDVAGSDSGIVSGTEFERPRGVSRRCEDVLDLTGFRQRVEERGAGCVGGRACSVARRCLSRIAGLLSRPVRRPCAVAERLGALSSIREHLCGVDCFSWTPIVRTLTLEDRQCTPCACRRIAGDRPKFRPAEFDRRGAVRHGVIPVRSAGNSKILPKNAKRFAGQRIMKSNGLVIASETMHSTRQGVWPVCLGVPGRVRKNIVAHSPVIPAKAGTQYSAALFVDECTCPRRGCHVSSKVGVYWVPAFAGMTPLEMRVPFRAVVYRGNDDDKVGATKRKMRTNLALRS